MWPWATAFLQSVSNLWVSAGYNLSVMTEQSILESFIIRIYRIDTKDPERVTGILESIDGSGEPEPFVGLDELGLALTRRARRRGRRRRGTPPGPS